MDKFKNRNIKQFDGDNYAAWKVRMSSLLKELKVLEVVTSEPPEEVTAEWNEKEDIARNTVLEYLADSFVITYATASAKNIIDDLDKIYARKSFPSQLAIRRKLFSLKQKSFATLKELFRMFMDLMAELEFAGGDMDEMNKITLLLEALPPVYDNVVTAIETISANKLSLSFVKTKLLDYETKLQKDSSDTSLKILQADKVKPNQECNNKKYNNNNQQTRNIQFKRYGNQQQIKCHQSGRLGHMKAKCFHYLRAQKYKYKNNVNYQKQKNINQVNKVAQFTNVQKENISNSSFAFMAGDCVNKTTFGEINFVLDSGATNHIINESDLAKNFDILPHPIKISIAKNDVFILATKRGNLYVKSEDGFNGVLMNVLYCEELPQNLLSVAKMQEAGYSVLFDENGVTIMKESKIMLRSKLSNNLTILKFQIINVNAAHINRSLENDYNLWHQRLGHIGKSKFLELKSKNMVSDIDEIENVRVNDVLCEACIKGKQSRLPFSKAKDKTHIRRPLYIVHSDVCLPITPPTIDNKNYFVLFIDEYTHYCVTYLITYKSDVLSVFRDFIAKSEARFNLKIVYLYTDNGGEYLSSEMKELLVKKGISYHLTVPRTPQLNGVAERMVRTVTEKARAMLAGTNLSKEFWGEAVLTATYLINITPTNALQKVATPYELWHEKKPKLKYLKIFGAIVYMHNKIRKTKFDEKTIKGILVGYAPNAYKVYNVETGQFIVARDVIVDERNFLKFGPEGVTKEKCQIENDVNESFSETDQNRSDKTDEEKSVNDKALDELVNDINEIGQKQCKLRKEDETLQDNLNDEVEIRRSKRISNKPNINYDEELYENYMMSAHSIVCKIPNTYNEIKENENRDQWEKAVEEEINSLILNNTWTLVPRPQKTNIVNSKWIITIKNDADANPIKFKARLVAKGFSQKYLEDYYETFAPVARFTSFRLIIAFANQFNLLLHQMDVRTAFLNGNLDEEIYMSVPEGIKCEQDKVCKLNKSLYGLKQAARCWYEAFDIVLKERGFKSSKVDPCIYVLDKKDIQKNIYVVLYVDDLIIATGDMNVMNDFKYYLKNKFHMVDLKDVKLFLGVKVIRTNNKIMLDQSAYIKTVLKRFNMYDSKPVGTPLEVKVNYEALNSDKREEAPCRNVLGSLMYVMTCTRPDISAAVNILSRFTNKNNAELWKCLKRLLRYLKGTVDLKLTYKKTDYKEYLVGYADSDWGSDTIDRKSTSGFIVKLYDNCIISWGTKKQSTVATSSTEAEYVALNEAAKEIIWVKSLLETITLKIPLPIIIFEDNMGCINIAKNPISHKRTKHISIKYHYIRDLIKQNIIKLEFISTEEQVADAFTKPLHAPRLEKMRNEMGLEVVKV